jgi:hypothetical protein
MGKQRVWPDGEGISEAMDEAVVKVIGLAELFFTSAEEIPDLKSYIVKGMFLNLENAALELRDAYRSLCEQEAEEGGEKAETG